MQWSRLLQLGLDDGLDYATRGDSCGACRAWRGALLSALSSFRSLSSAEQQRVADDLSRLIENAIAPIFGVDTSGKVTVWSRKSAEFVGFSKDETLGK